MSDDKPARPTAVQRWRALAPAAADCVAWAAGLSAALALRFDVAGGTAHWDGLTEIAPVACALQLAAGLVAGLYQARWRLGSFEEVAALISATASAAIALFGLNLLLGRPVPASVPFGGGVLALAVAGGLRYVWRLRRERTLRPRGDRVKQLLIFGAGEAGAEVVTRLLRTPDSPYLPVAFLDDDPAKRHLRIRGVPVLGSRSDLERVAAKVRADVFLVAVRTGPLRLARELAPLAEACGMAVRVLPSVAELLGRDLGLTDIRPLAEAELLGREPVRIDESRVGATLADRRVLVTGAGGSIGSELCRQIARFRPAQLVMLDRDESALHGTQLLLEGHARLDTPDLVVADIRDEVRVHDVFARYRPQVVFHAAALKHLPLLELHPTEAVKTNIGGTENVLLAALDADVERFVNISTDKAAEPISVLGFTKRITERLTSWASTRSSGTYLSVRFGNVLGSRGSILTTFQSQIAAGGPVTVTDPKVTRFFMTVEEAVALVLQAAVVGRDGQALVLDMGEPVSILRLAERLVAAAPDPPEIVFTGLRRGEKLHETPLAADEVDHRPFHPLLAHVAVPPLGPHPLESVESMSDEELAEGLPEACVLPDADTHPSMVEVGYVVIDGDARIAAVNRAALRMLRVPFHRFSGRIASEAPWNAMHADGTPMLPSEYPGVVTRETGRPLDDIVFSIVRGDGTCAWFSFSARPMEFEREQRGAVVTLRAIACAGDPT